MKVRSQRKSKRTTYLKTLIITLVLLLIALITPVVVTTISRVVLYPFYATQTWFRESTGSLPTLLREKKELLEEIEKLESQLALAASTGLTQQRLYEENLWLRELLSADTQERIVAAVTARPNQLPYDILQIDQGSSAGIVTGAPVYVGVDTAIGVVAHVAENFAFVELFTTPGFEATVFVGGTNITATLEGYGGGVARVRVPQGIPLTVGSLVHVPSMQPGVFGRIAYIENRPTQPEQYGYITLSKPIASINYVAVGKQPLAPATETLVRDEINSILEQSLVVEGMQSQLATTTASTTEEEI